MPCYGIYNDGIMPFTKKVVCRFQKNKKYKLKSNETIIPKRKSRSVVGYINGVTHFAS